MLTEYSDGAPVLVSASFDGVSVNASGVVDASSGGLRVDLVLPGGGSGGSGGGFDVSSSVESRGLSGAGVWFLLLAVFAAFVVVRVGG